MTTFTDAIVHSTRLDRVNISVFGYPVLDVIVDIRPGAGHLAEYDAISKVAIVRHGGNLEFRPNTYIGYYLHREPIVWGPFNPDGHNETYGVGGKFEIPTVTGPAAEELMRGASTAILAGPRQHIGGGGANVLFGFYDVFAQLHVELLATVDSHETEGAGRLDRFIKPLTDKIGPYTRIPTRTGAGVNLVIEGLGTRLDRTIFTAQVPHDDALTLDEMPSPQGRAVMVNTIYAPQVALEALAHAVSLDRLGFLALTKGLCSTRSLPKELFDDFFARHPSIRRDIGARTFGSLHEFIAGYVLSNSDCICIVNEKELEHLTGVAAGVDRGDSYELTLGRIIEALRVFRKLQKGRSHRVYVTLGASGSVVVDEHERIIYCGVVHDRNRFAQAKTAIGDTYATFVLALETIGNYIRSYNIPAQDVIKASAAGADSGVYDGFGNLTVNKVNTFLGDPSRILVSLGTLQSFPCSKWMDRPVDAMRSSDWEMIVETDYINHYSGFVPTTLQEVIGRAFLRLPGEDGPQDQQKSAAA
jgi:hypothetical protein